MSIYFLQSSDFSIENGKLAINMGGITLVMFYSQKCSYCMTFLPEFKKLPSNMMGVNFALCSVDDPKKMVVQMSHHTTTPIKNVPKFLLYNDGIPQVEYNGQRNRQSVIAFLEEVLPSLNQRSAFTRPRRTRQDEVQMQMPQQSQMVQPPRQNMQVQSPQQVQQPYTISPQGGVKEYATSYGRPYNTINEEEFLEYEKAYSKK
jgi:hypothetical protein